ncbi:MAG: LysM peptidoglycan-binding domain-containing protein [Chthoniobacterales bacterium]|nr:LysM peptidoglycan-binding domain-containing protein [Chthoniobacterales bacterium]MDQ3120306.1 LysM peptidoglycan-binding domain-containing protein [Verrucomicrobiota bacterium]
MKIPQLLIRKKKLRASTARRSMAASDEMDYEEMSEPNMKLSRALLIVLVLHVVAVAGIIAFNTIKSRQGAFPPPKVSTSPVAVEAAPVAQAKTETPASLANSLTSETKPEASKVPRALPVGSEAGNFYVVAKGDNPVKIAKKLKVTESELLAVNHIDDPRKLQIGQRLIVPASKKPKTKAGN